MQGSLILGFPRSGTTLLRRLLGAHPEIAAPPETGLMAGVSRLLREEPIVNGVSVGVLNGLALGGFAREDVLARTRAFVCGFLEDYATRHGATQWVEKNPHDIFHLPAIEAVFGDRLRYIVLVRHALDVVCSVKELVDITDRYQEELHAYVRANPRPTLAMAEAWRDTTRDALDFAARHPNQCVVVRYEDLAADPLAELARVGDLLGVTFTADHIAQALGEPGSTGFGDWKTYGRPTIDTSSVGRWSALSKSHVWELGQIVNPVLERAGYPAVKGRPPAEGDKALRRHHLAMMVQAMRKEEDA